MGNNVKKDPSALHPVYAKMASWWHEGWDFYRGGMHILQPQEFSHDVYFANVTEDTSGAEDDTNDVGESPSKARKSQIADYTASREKSYLWSHGRELKPHYNDRKRRQHHLAIYGPAIDSHADAVLRVSPQRDIADKWWQGVYKDADTCGTSWNSTMRDSLSWGCVWGRCHVLIDMPMVTQPVKTRADEIYLGLRPYMRILTPLDIVNWSLDVNGVIRWATYREPAPDMREPGQVTPEQAYQYRTWTPHECITWSPIYNDNGDSVTGYKENVHTHDLGFVPIFNVNAEHVPDRSWQTQGLFPSLQRGDRVLLNLISLYHDILFGQTFSTIWLPDPEGLGVKGVTLGTKNALVSATKPDYVSPDTRQADVLSEAIKDHVTQMRQVAFGRGISEESKEARSAGTLQEESEQKRVMLARLAESMEEFESKCHYAFAAWMGRGPVPVVKYGRNFDLKTLRAKLSESSQFKGIDCGPDAMYGVKKILLQQQLRELGADAEEQIRAEKALRAYTDMLMKYGLSEGGEVVISEVRTEEQKKAPEDGPAIRDGEME